MKLQAGVGRPRPWGQAPRSSSPVQPGLEPGSPLRVAGGAMRAPPPETDRRERHAARSPGRGGREAAPRPLARPCSVLRGRAERLGPDGRRAPDACCPALCGVAGSSMGLPWGPVFTKSLMGKMLPPAWRQLALHGPHPCWQWHWAPWRWAPWRCSRAQHPCPPSREPNVWPNVVRPPLTPPLAS